VVALLTAVLALMPLAVSGGLGVASAKCRPGDYHSYRNSNDGQHYFAGWKSEWLGYTVGGTYAQILNYSPWVEPSPNPLTGSANASTAWVMVTHTSLNVYAQVGWIELAYGQRYTVTQHKPSPSSNPVTHFFQARPVGEYTYYTVLWNNPAWKFSYWVGSTMIFSEDYGFLPNRGDIASEITTYSSQMPGSSATWEALFDGHVYVGGWQNFNGTVVPHSAEFTVDGPYYGTLLYTKDSACAS
jgi:hypothetical protein